VFSIYLTRIYLRQKNTFSERIENEIDNRVNFTDVWVDFIVLYISTNLSEKGFFSLDLKKLAVLLSLVLFPNIYLKSADE